MSPATANQPWNTMRVWRRGTRTAGIKLVEALDPDRHIHRILDYGCGYGYDVEHYRGLGYDADGYDPYRPGFERLPEGTYDLVTLVYVLNVIDSSIDRQEVVSQAAHFLDSAGALLVVTRSPREILRAKNNAARPWPVHSDGYWTDPAKGMFQHGLDEREIEGLGRQAALDKDSRTTRLPAISGATRVLLHRPA